MVSGCGAGRSGAGAGGGGKAEGGGAALDGFLAGAAGVKKRVQIFAAGGGADGHGLGGEAARDLGVFVDGLSVGGKESGIGGGEVLGHEAGDAGVFDTRGL